MQPNKKQVSDAVIVIRLLNVAKQRHLILEERQTLWDHSASLWVNMLPETRHRILNLCDDIERVLR
jgi:hypothetical protein